MPVARVQTWVEEGDLGFQTPRGRGVWTVNEQGDPVFPGGTVIKPPPGPPPSDNYYLTPSSQEPQMALMNQPHWFTLRFLSQ